MNGLERQHCFIDFVVQGETALERLSEVSMELQRHKETDCRADDAYWLPLFNESDRAAFWWPNDDEKALWNAFWLSTPLPQRHHPQMPLPAWCLGSMIAVILESDYDIVGIRTIDSLLARLEFDPHGHPYGGTEALRALVRAFGHKIAGFDDGTGFTRGDPQPPRWTSDMTPLRVGEKK